jgi:hypothetical protein
MSAVNKATRANQNNARHTAGTRSFAVVHEQEVGFLVMVCVLFGGIVDPYMCAISQQVWTITDKQFPYNCVQSEKQFSFEVVVLCKLQEIKQGQPVSRSQLYRIVHTNKDGLPVDDYSAAKIVCTILLCIQLIALLADKKFLKSVVACFC